MMYKVIEAEVIKTLLSKEFSLRGFDKDEVSDLVRASVMASQNGIRTHGPLKALHLDELFGSQAGGCLPCASIEVKDSRFKAVEHWDAHRKSGPSVAFAAMERCMELADTYGVGVVSVDQCFHYLWGGGYVIDAAKKGYIAYTCCTAALAEVVPYLGKNPTLGTNPHSWAFPTTDVVGFPICVDWATSAISMGKVQELKREGLNLPPNAALNAKGEVTDIPAEASALLPFAGHKGYGLGLIDELYAAFAGSGIPTIRSRWSDPRDEKKTPNFFFQCIHPEAIGPYRDGEWRAPVERVVRDILGPGNEACILPGQIEAAWAQHTEQQGGLIFTDAEVLEFSQLGEKHGINIPSHQIGVASAPVI